MKKYYEELSITPLQVYAGSPILQGSIVQEDAVVVSMGQPVQNYDFNDSDTFQQDWE